MLRKWAKFVMALGIVMTMTLTLAQGTVEGFVPVTDEVLQNPSDGDWLMFRRTLNAWGYSPLDQITPENVDELRLVWSRGMTAGHMEATPLVYNGVMYLPHPGDVIQALDATTGDLIWEYARELPEGVSAIASIKRNLAIWDNLIITSTADQAILALDAATGQVVWETSTEDATGQMWQSSGPIIANGKAISGRSCLDRSGCFIAAHDLSSGEELWRTYTMPAPGEPGSETWGDSPIEAQRHVGSWMPPSYDPELNLVYVGTSVTNPYVKFMFGDVNDTFLYQTSTLALDADTGEIVWYYQHIQDHWDLDHPYERVLIDTVVAPNADEVRWISPNVTPGETRRVLTGIPGKTGIFYSIDRATGELLWARETVYQNVIEDIDVVTGDVRMVQSQIPTEVGQTFLICPAAVGGKDWQTGAYSPLTNTLYYSLQNLCMNSVVSETNISLPATMAPNEENVGTIVAIDVATGEQTWKWENRAATMSLVTTGGGLIFGGDVNHRFRAFDQANGEVLWETILAGPVGGFPITYEVDGRQYVAVTVGTYLISGTYLGQTPELRPGMATNSIFVFALPTGN